MNVSIFISILLVIFLGIGVWQLAVIFNENGYKNRGYRAATSYARKNGKPLLVAGGPWGLKPIRKWLKKPAHGSGDVCLDIDRRSLGNHPGAVIADITRIPFTDKSFGAAFASHILEHLATVEDAERALSELRRVADTIFIVYPSRQSILAWLKREHHLWLWQKKDVVYLKQRGGSNGNREVRKFRLPVLETK